MTKQKSSDQSQPSPSTNEGSRRKFLKDGSKIIAAGAAMGSVVTPSLSIASSANVRGSDTIRIGLVGCGGRGAGAAVQAMHTKSGNVELVAMGDVFPDRMQTAIDTCQKNHPDTTHVAEDQKFIGYDAYKAVLASDINLVILATPPGFRPLHFEAAVEAGKNVFMEKPVAVDAPGIRRVLKAGELAKEKGLAVAVGIQRRHERRYQQVIKALQGGIIGDLVHTRVYWNSDGVWKNKREALQSELEYQMRNWYYFNWLCGDHIVEQHIHNLDVANWLMNDYPAVAQGMGGRQVRTGPDTGQIFDHHAVEFTYPNGHRLLSHCRHIPDTWSSVSEHVHGADGHADISGGRIYDKSGKIIFEVEKIKGEPNGWQQEHHDLFASLRAGVIPNEAEYGAKSTMTSIFGRMATYSGKEIKWEDAINSNIQLCNVDALTGMNDEAPVQPNADGSYPIPLPGVGASKILDWDF